MSKRRFSAQEGTVKKALRLAFERMGVEKRYDIKEFGDGTIRIAFVKTDEEGRDREYQFICDEFEHPGDNLRAVEQAITMLWRIYEIYMVRTTDVDYKFGTIFAGFQVTEGQKVLQITDGKQPRWEILGLPKDATPDEIRERWRQLAKENHPDNNGDKKEFQRLNAAYEEFVNMRN